MSPLSPAETDKPHTLFLTNCVWKAQGLGFLLSGRDGRDGNSSLLSILWMPTHLVNRAAQVYSPATLGSDDLSTSPPTETKVSNQALGGCTVKEERLKGPESPTRASGGDREPVSFPERGWISQFLRTLSKSSWAIVTNIKGCVSKQWICISL